MIRRYSWRRVWRDLRDGHWAIGLDLGPPLVGIRWMYWDAQILVVRLCPLRLCVGWAVAPRFDDQLDEDPAP